MRYGLRKAEAVSPGRAEMKRVILLKSGDCLVEPNGIELAIFRVRRCSSISLKLAIFITS